jgi:hypothetical protein
MGKGCHFPTLDRDYIKDEKLSIQSWQLKAPHFLDECGAN